MAAHELVLPVGVSVNAASIQSLVEKNESVFRSNLDQVSGSLIRGLAGLYLDDSLSVEKVEMDLGRIAVSWSYQEPVGCSDLATTHQHAETWRFEIDKGVLRLEI